MNFKIVKSALAGLFLSLFVINAQAQNKTVTGKVTDSKDGSAIVAASVVGQGTTIGVRTAADGSFKISVPSSVTTLFISSVGYASKQVTIAGGDLKISLVESSEQLNEVVVIGYGTARKKDVTGAVSSVQAKDFNQGVITTPDQLLQNKVAGLDITSASGQPGAATTVKIRGNNSVRANSNPLYVIDGVPLDGRSARPSAGTGFGSSPDANPLNFINPNDIQSVDVLKDASSAAIYGSRGANGVIVITTKSGSSTGTKLEFGTSISANAGLMKNYEVLNAATFVKGLAKYAVTGQDFGSNVNAMNELLNKDLSQNYNLALSGGNDNGKFRASFNGSSTNGTIKGSTLDKYVANFGGQYKFLDKRLTLGFGLTYGHTNENVIPFSNNAGSQGNIISAILQWNPTQKLKDASGNFIYPTNGSGNPLAMLKATDDKVGVNSVLANIRAAYKISENLEYRLLYAVNNSNGSRNTNVYGFLQGISGVSGLGTAAISNAQLTSQTITHTLNFKKDITANLNVDALAGFEYWTSDYSNNSFSGNTFNTNLDANKLTLPYTSTMANAKTMNTPGTYVSPTTELQSYFGRVQLNQSDKYYLTGTLRADGSSKFGANNKYAYFPSVGAKWAIINENFMKANKLFSNLAFRASYGITGNQEFPAGASQEQFYFGSFNNAGQVNVANPNLKWEESRSIDLGIEFSTKNGKIYGAIDWYDKNTSNILFQSTAIQPAPASIYFINLPNAQLNNTGVEFTLGANLLTKKDLTWDVNGYIAFNKNMLTKFTQNGQDIQILTGSIDGQGVSGTLGQVITNNQPINEFYLKKFLGFDKNGNQTFADNPTFAGNPNPTTTFGLSTTVNYKKFTFVVNGGGSAGYSVYNNTATSVTNIAGIANGRNISLAAYNSVERASSPVAANSRFLESGDFFKLRNASVSYHFGNYGKYIKNLNAFISGNNLFVITKFTGFDPEVNIDKGSNNYPSRSIEYLPYPTARTFSAGVNFSL
jgi:iron complex outermembrane receptor protein